VGGNRKKPDNDRAQGNRNNRKVIDHILREMDKPKRLNTEVLDDIRRQHIENSTDNKKDATLAPRFKINVLFKRLIPYWADFV
jgi:hypothetical protein